jgi:hypothetical protein
MKNQNEKMNGMKKKDHTEIIMKINKTVFKQVERENTWK